jgi:ubiquinone/menaquinone biosynthesis C-methylase UbiE
VNDPYPAICDYEGSDYEERFWLRGGRAYEDGAEALALKRLLPSAGDRLLELGAGAGRNTPRYAGFREITLLDYSRSQLDQARARLGDSPRYRYVVADVYRMPFGPGAFDAATMIRTLHHMQDPQTALQRVRQTLSEGSVFILEFANKRNLKAVVRWLIRRQAWNPFDQAAVEFARLNYDFHPRAVDDWLATAMFHVERRVPVSHFRIGWFKSRAPLPLLLGAEDLLQRLGSAWLYTPSIFLRTRAVGAGAAPAGFWRCPACESLEVDEAPDGLHCRGCGRHWPKRDGIYELRDAPPAR